MVDQGIVIGVVIGLMVVLYLDYVRPVVAFLIANIVLLLASINTSADMLAGFANEQLMVVMLLLVVSDVIQKTSVIEYIFSRFFRDGINLGSFLGRMVPGVTSVSGVINNTPLVAMLLPYVNNWALRNKISPSKVLMPLSYATIIGGTLTLVGTSTNLVVNGLIQEQGAKPLGMFDFTIPGAVVAVVAVAYLVFFTDKILPSRKSPLETYKESKREYLSELMVSSTSPLIGKTVEEAGLRNLKGLYLVEIIRHPERIVAVGPDERLVENDVLIFAGDTSTLIDLVKASNGLELPKGVGGENNQRTNVVECIVAPDSSLIGKTVKELNFRARFDGSVIAVNRGEERIGGKIGEIKIHSGDLLLVIAGNDFEQRVQSSHDIYLVSQVHEITNFNPWKSATLIAGLITAFTLSAVGALTLFKGLLLLVCLIVALNIIKYNELSKSVDFDLYIVLALALGLGKAISNSGLHTEIAAGVTGIATLVQTKALLLLCVYVITNLLAVLVTNKAAVAIMVPVTIETLKHLGVTEMTPYFLAIAFAGSAEFLTPYGYQTNLMVYGPGGYKFRDYLRFGWPLTLLYTVTVVTVLSLLYDLF
ncbi:MAG TPA: SLC13 family permease [Flavobacteriales bacterium]|nr:SLC13 family permease [Flavobacteriales bacterium]